MISLVIYAALIVGGYYLYQGIKRSVETVDSGPEVQQNVSPAATPALSRSEADRQKSQRIGEAIRDNPNIAKQKEHNEDVQKAIKQAENGGH